MARPALFLIPGLLQSAFILVTLLTVSAFAASAQSVTGQPTTCDYDRCALRLEDGRILRGVAGERVGKLGLFSSTKLTPIVEASRSDSAIAYARIVDSDYQKGNLMVAGGAVVVGVAMGLRSQPPRRLTGSDGALFGLAVSGLVVEVIGARKLARSQRALSRALWWNNRELR